MNQRRFNRRATILWVGISLIPAVLLAADAPYLEPGSLRLSHTLNLESVLHAVKSGQRLTANSNNNTIYTPDANANAPWTAEWGQSLVTEAAARFNREVSARVLFEAQGEYADRYWNPLNYSHDRDSKGSHLFVRQYEGAVKNDDYYLHGYSGVSRDGWADKGDLFELYQGVYPARDYLGSSGFLGVYPKNWQGDQYLNISRRRLPQGVEAGGTWNAIEADVAYGSELDWGYGHGGYGRLSAPIGPTRLNFFYANNDTVYEYRHRDDEREEAYALTWTKPAADAFSFGVGALYTPFRVGDDYLIARDADGGQGLLGSSHSISTKTVTESDGLGFKANVDGTLTIFEKVVNAGLNIEREGVMAGNKEQVGARLGADVGSFFHGIVDYTYRRPVEGPIPFLYEGTPDNIGAIAANPRGPESPFTVDWTNREASFLVTTVQFDATPGSTLFLYNPTDLATWNINPQEEAPLAVAFQHRMSDYKTSTDRQIYYNTSGEIVWEAAAHAGAWANRHPLHDFRVLALSRSRSWKWSLGFAGGQALAFSGVAYTTSTATNKPITEYYSLEFRLENKKIAYWGHYGSGVWGPVENIHPFFGESYDRLFGVGLSYNVGSFSTIDVSYLGARQDDDLFLPPSLGSFDEFRTVFSHRFGTVHQFKPPLPPGTDVR